MIKKAATTTSKLDTSAKFCTDIATCGGRYFVANETLLLCAVTYCSLLAALATYICFEVRLVVAAVQLQYGRGVAGEALSKRGCDLQVKGGHSETCDVADKSACKGIVRHAAHAGEP